MSWDTSTMAELFIQQGQADRAVGIYRKIVRQRPSDVKALHRLKELEAQLSLEKAPSSVRTHLQQLLESIPRATACILMGFDGMLVDQYEVGGSELHTSDLLRDYAAVMRGFNQVQDTQPLLGSVCEVLITTPRISTVLHRLNEDHFLAVILETGALTGQARYRMRHMAPQILKELA